MKYERYIYIYIYLLYIIVYITLNIIQRLSSLFIVRLHEPY